jgi:hypothetical protein
MTIPRYRNFLAEWKYNPPVNYLIRGISSALGYQTVQRPFTQADSGAQVFWDESYYQDTKKTPHSNEAFDNLKTDFAAAGGNVNG